MIGRLNEQKVFKSTLQSKESEFIAVVGRRRVGKTFLIEQYFVDNILFQISGQKDFTNSQHLQIFADKLKVNFPETKLPKRNNNWLNAFTNLIECLQQRTKIRDKEQQQKIVVFFDELPWLCQQKSGFLAALGYFWNEWARKNNIVLVICGSAASWMLSNIIKEKGSLYNRVTRIIKVQPFTIAETKAYLEGNGVYFNQEQLVQIYMVMGGIPFYLKEIEAGMSAVQNIQQICFSINGLLTQEYGNLYDALFKNSTEYKKIIEVLFGSKQGLTKMDIASATKLTPNGSFYDKIEELVECGFIIEIQNMKDQTKSNLFRLIDEYSLFYHQFIKKHKVKSDVYWYSMFNSSAFHSWSGYAFENFCLRHLDSIIETLQIKGMQYKIGSFYSKKNEDAAGAQIDILIDREDGYIHIVECKYYKHEFYLSSDEIAKIIRRKAIFKHYSKTKKHLFITLVSLGNLLPSKESLGVIDQEIGAKAFV